MIKHNYPGKFIVIEGLDGSGKSSQIDLLVAFLQVKNKEVILTAEPTKESEAGIKIRKILKGEIKAEPMERQNLFVQDRKEHLERKIIPALQRGTWVVCSRYIFSTLAFGSADGLDFEELRKMNQDFLLPDVTIFLNVSPEECIKRIEARGEQKELFEKLDQLKKVDSYYQKMPAMFENFYVVEGGNEISVVFEKIKKIIENFL